MYIWAIFNISFEKQYQKLYILPGGFIPGSDKPKNVDSFLFPGIHHVTALQNEGLHMWDPLTNSCYLSNLYLLFTTADGPGLVYLDGMIGHSSKNGCQVYCGVIGHCKECSTHYHPALLCTSEPFSRWSDMSGCF
ncbi:hypothetical protein PAXRUDRAFT_162876 [Paxillus rubicundulus Ve08.2h10]|uniref:Uncharacterized protein n=1 Tax=Paxillus rubicundulus Ve08.2h10 TaxID=930991 RepID=A0A0D0DDM3_9AGAM|nr:hypothetical protein PAXRUDRAFT_162876 [Paxillus rubicundulus Ve08.2h10]